MRSLIIAIGIFACIPFRGASQDIMPEYPGGISAMLKFVQENLVYPDSAKIAKVQGKVIIKFAVDTTGQVTDISVVSSPSPLLNEAAMSVVRKMPRWEPGSQGGKRVKVNYNLPLNFNFTEDKKK